MVGFWRSMVIVLGCAAASLWPGEASAQERLLTQYIADLGPQDHFNSSGTQLTTFAALLAQDRANVHRFGIRHRHDQIDPVFAARAMRAQINVQTVQIQHYYQQFVQHILRDRPPGTYIVVYVYGYGSTITRVTFDVPG